MCMFPAPPWPTYLGQSLLLHRIDDPYRPSAIFLGHGAWKSWLFWHWHDPALSARRPGHRLSGTRRALENKRLFHRSQYGWESALFLGTR